MCKATQSKMNPPWQTDGAPDEENDHNISEADGSNSSAWSDSDSNYTPNKYLSHSENSLNITCIFLVFFLKVFRG